MSANEFIQWLSLFEVIALTGSILILLIPR